MSLLRSALIVSFTALSALGLARSASAQGAFVSEQSRAELVAERSTAAPGESVWVALKLDVAPGWHTYWRTPGDSGLPAEIHWSLADGMTAGAIQWPTPERIAYGDLMNFGYHGTVLLLTQLQLGQDVAVGETTLTADATWLVCSDICIPESASFELPFSVAASGDDARGNATDTPSSAAIAATRDALPTTATWPSSASVSGTTLTFTARPELPGEITGAAFFPYEEGVIINAAPQELHLANGEVRLSIAAGDSAAGLDRIDGLLVLETAGAATGYEVSAPVSGAPKDVAAEASSMTLAAALLLAFLGGLILNVMPCVLPVLAMKAMSFVSRGASDARALKRDGLAYTAGVMVAFGLLAGLLLVLRTGSSAIGWGFQLQSPPFVAALAFVMLTLGLSLSGVFTIRGSFGVGHSLTARNGASGSFFTGLLAVVVATPCTAPFMGAALGFALTQTSATTVLIFEALALGLAFPYLLLSFVPGVARALPRPGAWMERVKQALAFPLYAAAAWLVWVLSQQVDAAGFALAMTGLVFVGFAAWLWGIATTLSARARPWTRLATTAAVVIALTSIYALHDQAAAAPAPSATSDIAEPYSERRLAQLRAEGRPVFVNFTAAWCISCLVNERIALSRPEVLTALKDRNVVYLKGDWTNRNAEIAAALHGLDRDGVPLYVLYAPNAEPRVLPQVLTPSLVVDALNAL